MDKSKIKKETTLIWSIKPLGNKDISKIRELKKEIKSQSKTALVNKESTISVTEDHSPWFGTNSKTDYDSS